MFTTYGREAQREPRHHVGVDVVVDDGRVLVGPGDAVDVEAGRVGVVVEAEVGEQSRDLDQHLGALVAEELDVAGGRDVAVDGVRDVGVDVVLGGAGRVVRRRLLAVDRAPGEQRAALRHLRRPLASLRQRAVSEPQQVAGGVGVVVGEHRDHVHLGVPEVVPVVAAGRHRLGGDAALADVGRRLRHLEQVPADRLLCRVVAVDGDVGPLPELGEPRRLLARALPAQPAAIASVDRGQRLHSPARRRSPDRTSSSLTGGVVGDVLGECQRLAGSAWHRIVVVARSAPEVGGDGGGADESTVWRCDAVIRMPLAGAPEAERDDATVSVVGPVVRCSAGSSTRWSNVRPRRGSLRESPVPAPRRPDG